MLRKILYYLSTMLYFLGLAHLVPLIFSIIVGESVTFISAILIDIVLLLFLGYVFRRISIVEEIGLVEAFTVMVLSFIIPAFTCAFPIMVYGYSFIDALFEGVSAITTTGLSVLDYGEVSIGIEFLRAFYQWLGGIGIALLVVSFMLAPGSAAYNIYLAHLGKYKIAPLSSRTIRIILSIYVSLTMIYIMIYLFSGLSLIDSIINALTTISTGGFSRLTYFSGIAMYSAIMLMFVSAQPLALFYFIRKGNIKKILSDPQLISFTTIVFISSIALYLFDKINYASALFQVVSALSTTGYTSVN
ncbi:MAG: TrkH family potassium uptake protein, partial [Staphylothermus sp.]|nr:TrkH family potassium uptake protein [Staphylothermus sp.]